MVLTTFFPCAWRELSLGHACLPSSLFFCKKLWTTCLLLVIFNAVHMQLFPKSHMCGDIKGMHLAITPILIYIVNPPRCFHLLMNEICSWFFTQDIQYRFVYFFYFLYLYYRALSFLLIRPSLSVFKIFTTFKLPRVNWKDFLILYWVSSSNWSSCLLKV